MKRKDADMGISKLYTGRKRKDVAHLENQNFPMNY